MIIRPAGGIEFSYFVYFKAYGVMVRGYSGWRRSDQISSPDKKSEKMKKKS